MRRLYVLSGEERRRLAEQVRQTVAGEPAVVLALLYGSFLDADGFHDVDVAVYLRGIALDGTAGLELAQRLSTHVGVPVDVRVVNEAPPSFLYHVLRGQLLISRDDALLEELMEETSRRYLDLALLLRHSTKEAFA